MLLENWSALFFDVQIIVLVVAIFSTPLIAFTRSSYALSLNSLGTNSQVACIFPTSSRKLGTSTCRLSRTVMSLPRLTSAVNSLKERDE